MSRPRLAAWGGVAPVHRDRGTMRGVRATWGGGAQVRTPLSMRTLVAVRYTPVLKRCDERLWAAGNAKKVALTACRRQRLPSRKAMVQHQQPWQGQEEPIASHPRPP